MARILGITNDITTCECCGKSNLKKTVVLDFGDAVKHYGCDCAAKAICGNKKDRKMVEHRATAIAMATQWLAAGHDAQKVKEAIWNRFGYPTSIRHGELHIGSFGRVSI